MVGPVFWVVLGITAFFEPLIFVPGLIVGLLSRSWRQTLLSVPAVPLLYWPGHFLVYGTRPEHLEELLPFIVAAGFAWSAIGFVGKKAWAELR